MIDKLFGWIDDRVALSRSGRHLLNKIFPDHWSFMIGEIALYSFIVLLLTGVFLTLYFVPSGSDVIYHGVYSPLKGQTVSEAFNSTVNLSFQVRGGLLMRQMHHWAANIFVGSIVVHMLRVFFTGAFRRPREMNWMLGTTLLILAIFNGFLGYSLPDDLISGTGIRIAFSITESIPFVGTYLGFFLFGGQYPGTAIIPRFFILHVLVLPLVIIGLLAGHLGMLVKHKHAQFRGRGARDDNVVGSPLWPTYAAKAGGFFFLTTGVTALLGAAVQINPIWQYGQYYAYKVSYAVQPDWYMGWLDGALRVMPSWEVHLPGHMIPTVFFPAVLLPGLTFNLIYAWPFIEARLTGDRAEHHLLERPRDQPLRTALGAAVFAFYFTLFGASATDVLANYLSLSLNLVLWSFRVLCIVVPLVVFPVAYKICLELQSTKGAGQRKRHNVVVRSAEGGYATVATPEYPGYIQPELDPVPLDDVDLVSAMARDGDDQADGVYRIPREYR
ncbi:MAG TPA: ubiquinol-cytochrome c reductase cytochrome b subunit [Acidimicrobiales bacterium]|nr:ubiquinol-cytochrome c reductase cytochrome b subunit [Acidimicrobiales bacterium]